MNEQITTSQADREDAAADARVEVGRLFVLVGQISRWPASDDLLTLKAECFSAIERLATLATEDVLRETEKILRRAGRLGAP
jgi:hypothetical protein